MDDVYVYNIPRIHIHHMDEWEEYIVVGCARLYTFCTPLCRILIINSTQTSCRACWCADPSDAEKRYLMGFLADGANNPIWTLLKITVWVSDALTRLSLSRHHSIAFDAPFVALIQAVDHMSRIKVHAYNTSTLRAVYKLLYWKRTKF